MENLSQPPNLESTHSIISKEPVLNKTLEVSNKIEDHISASEQGSFTHTLKNFFYNLKEGLSSHKLNYKKKSHYLESLFLSKISTERKEIKITKELKKTSELNKGEKGSWAIEMEKHEDDDSDSIWQKIKSLPHDSIIEQLINLAVICESKNSIEEQIHLTETLEFAIKIAELTPSKRSSKNDKTILEVQYIIGQIIFLAEHSPTSLENIKYQEVKESLETIHEIFLNHLEQMTNDLKKEHVKHEKTQLQCPEMSYWCHLCRKLADVLVTESGMLNIGIIDLLIDSFISLKKTPSSQEKSIIKGLSQIQNNPLVRVYLEKISAPDDSKSPANEVIRAALRLPLHHKITDTHAKKATVGALLSHPRQKSTNSCFATSFIIKMKETHPLHCINDYHHLISKGKLSRNVNGVKKDIPFLKRIEDDLSLKVVLDKECRLILENSKSAYLWESPGIESVCRALGINDPKKAIQYIIDNEFKISEESTVTLKIKKILKHLSEIVLTEYDDASVKNRLYSEACFAFSSETNHPLVKVWENCIAGMAESSEKSLIKSKIFHSCFHSLQMELTRLKTPESTEITYFLKKIQSLLHKSIQLKYDPGLENDTQEELEFLTLGAFVLYKGSFRIDNKNIFCNLIKEVISTAYEELSIKEDGLKYKKFQEVLLSHIETPCFLKNMLKKYRSQQHLKSYDEIKFTPWITNTGNNLKKVLEVYFESSSLIKTHSLKNSSTDEFACSLIELGRDLYKNTANFSLNNRMCGRIHHLHALTAIFNHPLIFKAIKSYKEPKKWINKHIIQPGLKIAHSQIGSQHQKQINTAILDTICPLFLSKKEMGLFYESLEKLDPGLTVIEYRIGIISLFNKSENRSKTNILKISNLLDSTIYNSLNTSLNDPLNQSVLYFADSNWSKKMSDVYFCLLLNPGTGALEIWNSMENGNFFHRLNQEEWLTNKEWEFFSLPNDHHPNIKTLSM
jgi:hypothetical protein